MAKRGMRLGSCVEHGCAHEAEHRRWSRRDFVSGLGLAAGAGIMLGSTAVTALGRSPLLEHLRRGSSDRILVLIQLEGGNDGLNTIIPVEDDHYFRARPGLAIPKSVALPLTSTLGLHPALAPLSGLYGDGHMGIVQGVGYPSSSLSHFRGTDIWMSGRTDDPHELSGWTGRQLETEYRGFVGDPTPYPLAVQIGGLSSVLFQGSVRNMGMSVSSAARFQRLVSTGRLYDESGIPDTAYGHEISYVRRVANDAFRYGKAIYAAAESGRNEVSYSGPNDNWLAYKLSVVARLIKGNLGARVYHVSFGGFDTHGSQGATYGRHATLLGRLAEAVPMFLQDLRAGGPEREVLVMTFSEFGRRVEENGSEGTDHGTAAPLFLFGPGAKGGLFGMAPSLSDLDDAGNLKHGVDFRAVYSTVLRDWFGFSASASETVPGASFEPMGLVAEPADPHVTRRQRAELPEQFELQQNFPNPFASVTTIPFALRRTDHVRLRVFDLQGRLIRTLVDEIRAAGQHEMQFEAQGLSSGRYMYRLEGGGAGHSKTMTVVR